MGVCVPEELGGAGADFLSYILVLEELSRADAGVGVTVAVHTSAATLPIVAFGTDEQKARFVPPLARGEALGAFALTEPDSGSDAGSIRTTAVADGDGWVLTRLEAVDHERQPRRHVPRSSRAPTSAPPGARGVSRFLLDASHVEVTREEEKLGLNSSSTADIRLDGARVGARPPAARGAQGVHRGDGDARRRPHRDRRAGRRHRPGRVRHGARATRSSGEQFGRQDRRVPGDPVQARRHGHRDRRGPAAHATAPPGSSRPACRTAREGAKAKLFASRRRGRRRARRRSRCSAATATRRSSRSSGTTATRRSPRSTRARARSSASSSPARSCRTDAQRRGRRRLRVRCRCPARAALERPGRLRSAMPRAKDEPVRLTRIYTRGGDAGETSLGDGSRRLEARRAHRRLRHGRRAQRRARRRARGRRPDGRPAAARARPERALRPRRRPLRARREVEGRLRVEQADGRRARGGLRPLQRRAARAAELRAAGRHARLRPGCTSRARSAAAPSARRSRPPGEHDVSPLVARVPEPALRPALHPRPRRERARRAATSRSGSLARHAMTARRGGERSGGLPRRPAPRADVVRRPGRPHRLLPRRVRRSPAVARRARVRRARRGDEPPARARRRARSGSRSASHRAGQLGGLAAWLGFTLPSAIAMTALALLVGAGRPHRRRLGARARARRGRRRPAGRARDGALARAGPAAARASRSPPPRSSLLVASAFAGQVGGDRRRRLPSACRVSGRRAARAPLTRSRSPSQGPRGASAWLLFVALLARPARSSPDATAGTP